MNAEMSVIKQWRVITPKWGLVMVGLKVRLGGSNERDLEFPFL